MKCMSPFHTATLKLTTWYLAILVAVSVAFSVVIYNISARELDRPLLQDGFSQTFQNDDMNVLRLIREARAEEGKQSLLGNLIILNTVTLSVGAAASYFFARRTLQPIEGAMEAQSRFVSDASHELRTPLAVMKAENEVALREKEPTALELKGVLKSNLEEVDRLQLLTDRLLALSSQQPLVLEEFDTRDVVTEVVRQHELAAKHKKIKFVTTDGGLKALGDLDTVRDIISILVDNAVKYSPASTTVSIAASEQNHHVLLSVSDEGDGVNDEEKTKIFERFYRADESRSKANVEGHGLGLALAARLSELNNARLTVADNQPRGAVFALELPKA